MPENEYIYHYTSLDGLKGILESGEIWATDIRFLNDTSEATHGVNSIRRHIEEYIAAQRHSDTFGADVLELWNRIEWKQRSFVACFSKKDDDLSQWRAYGRMGYSIGFDRAALERNGLNPPIVKFCDLHYSDEMLKNEVWELLTELERVMNGRTLGRAPGSPLSHLYSDLIYYVSRMMELISRYKDEAFKDEAEVRALHLSNEKDAGPMIRESSLGPTPYITLSVGSESQSVIRTIRLCPTPHAAEAEVGVLDLLRLHKVRADVLRSRIPFRW